MKNEAEKLSRLVAIESLQELEREIVPEAVGEGVLEVVERLCGFIGHADGNPLAAGPVPKKQVRRTGRLACAALATAFASVAIRDV